MIKKVSRIQLNIVLLVLLLMPSVIFVFINYSIFTNPVFSANKIDSVISGDETDLSLIDIKNNVIFILDRNYQNKKYGSILSQTENLYLPIIISEDKKFKFDNKYFDYENFNLKIQAKEKLKLQLVYDQKINQLKFFIPGNNLVISENSAKVDDVLIYTIQNLSSDRILQIGDDISIDLSNYKNNVFVSFATLKNLTIKQYQKNKDFLLFEKVIDIKNFQLPTTDIILAKNIKIKKGQNQIELLDKKSLLNGKTASFEKGLWQKRVNDCDDNSLNENFRIDMNLSKDATEGKNSLKISSKNRIACTYTTFPVTLHADMLYKLYFDYKNIEGGKLSYYYNLTSDDMEEKERKIFNIFDTRWNKYEVLIEPKINGIDTFRIDFLAPSNGDREVVNLFDNVKLEYYENLTDVSKNQNKENLLNSVEASFEKGLWTREVKNCSEDFIDHPEINMSLNTDSSKDMYSLNLSSTKGYACTSKVFSIPCYKKGIYKLSFDYKNLKGNKVGYGYSFQNSSKIEHYSEKIQVADNSWHTFETIIDSKLHEIDQMNFNFYASSDRDEETINLYDNIRLTEYLPKDIDSYYLHAEQEVDKTPKLRSVEYKAVNRWKNKVVLHGVKDSFLLVYPEKYSEKWKVYLSESKIHKAGQIPNDYFVPEIESNRQATKKEIEGFISGGLISSVGNKFISKNFDGSIRNDNLSNGWFGETWFANSITEDIHFQVNNYSNSWWIDVDDICKNKDFCVKNPDGTYDMELIIENKMLKWFYVGMLVSGTALFGCISYLGYDLVKRRRRKRLGEIDT